MKVTKKLLSIFTFISLFSPVVFASGLDAIDNKFKIDPIYIPFFPVFDAIDPRYAKVLSWVTFIASVLIVLVVVFWIARILIAGVEAIRSAGDQEKLAEAYKKIQSNLVGVGITFLIPIILSVIGLFLGFGTIFNWPKMFTGCPKNSAVYDDNTGERISGYEYYFQAYFDARNGQDPAEYANDQCTL